MPSSLAHKVWILDCTHCGLFITNRAMKAVLLLRPNVSLYSSDALPLNCSAHNAGSEPSRATSSHKHNASPAPARTCECLTQSLSCHGCGSTVGYMIVNPCSRCTSSISATNRATNGHRFVFHSNEVTGTERYYVKDEPGVVPYDPPVHHHHHHYHHHPDAHVLPPFTSHPVPSQSSNPRPASPQVRADYLPTPPLEFATPHWIASRHQSPEYDASPAYYRQSRSPPPFVPAHSPSHTHSRRSPPTYPYPSSSDSSSAYRPTTRPRSRSPPPPLPSSTQFAHPSTTHPYPHPADHNKEQDLPAHPGAPSLKSGDPLFWHHLARSGEIPGVADNKQARTPAAARTTSSTPDGQPRRQHRMRDVTFNR